MTITARMLTQDKDGIGGYMAHPDGAGRRPGVLLAHHAHGVTADYKIDAYRLAQLGFNVLAPSLFNMFGIPGTNHIGQGADLQAKHSDSELDPRRLAPFKPTLAHSPAAYRPGIGVAPVMSVSTPPIM